MERKNATLRDKTTRILLIDDDPGDVEIIREMLRESDPFHFRLDTADLLSTGMECLTKGGIELVLLDLGLPDAQGLNALEQMHRKAPEIPIIVLTGLADENMGVNALRKAAQDYLVKGEVTGALLSRAIRYSLERNRLLIQLEEAKEREQRDREMHSFERLSSSPGNSVTARSFGLVSIREGQPKVFGALAGEYGGLMDRALEQKAYKIDHKISESLKALAEDMGFLKAGPRDVVELHRTVLQKKRTGAVPKKALAYMEEGRVMVLELMGYLTSYYRRRTR